jgi:MscS family membrane protein
MFLTEHLNNILWFAGILLGTLLLYKPMTALLAKVICSVVNRFTDRKHAPKFQQEITTPIELLLLTFMCYIALNQLTDLLQFTVFKRTYEGKPPYEIKVSDITDKIALFLLILFTTLTLVRVMEFIFHVLVEKAYEDGEKDRQQLYPLIKEVSKIIIWSMGTFWVLGSVFQVNIPALITGLGIGGVAIALAAKESVENFFASFTILADKPFQTGDTVRLSSLEGVVERIGFRSTRLRNGDGSTYIIPNKKLIGENLENLTQRDNRRVRLVLNMRYGMSQDKLRQMIAELKAMVQKTLHVIDPIEVALDSFGESVFQVVISYHLPEPIAEGGKVGEVKQEINVNAYGIASKYTVVSDVETETAIAPKEETEIKDEEKKEDDLLG